MANEPTKSWQTRVSELLAQAAQLAVEHKVDIEPFVRRANAAYLDARPGLREFLEEKQLVETLETMRAAGRIGSA